MRPILKQALRHLRSVSPKEWRVALTCFAIASVLWFFQAMSAFYSTDLKVLVEYAGQPKNAVLVNEPVDHLAVMVRAQGWDILGHRLWYKTPTYQLELGSYSQNISFTTSKAKDVLAEQLIGVDAVLNISPAQIQLNFEPSVKKRLPVKINNQLDFAESYGMAQPLTIRPDSVWVKGPSSLVDSLHFVLTKALKLENVKANFVAELELNQPAMRLVSLDTDKVEVQGSVEPLTEKTMTLPLKIKPAKGAENITLIPSRVTVKCNVPLSTYEKLSSQKQKGAQHFVAYVNAPQNANEELLTVKVETALNNVTGIKADPAFVNYVIVK